MTDKEKLALSIELNEKLKLCMRRVTLLCWDQQGDAMDVIQAIRTTVEEAYPGDVFSDTFGIPREGRK